jgi:enamine deaminase RidA (YjgF/YER057c/UK114 family)
MRALRSRRGIKMLRTLPFLLLLSCTAAAATKSIVIPPGRERSYAEYHYAPAVRVGDTVYVSGIPAPADGDEASRYTRLFERLAQVLDTAGASLADVVEIQSFHTNLADSAAFQAHFAKFLEAHKLAFPSGYPAWTAVGTTALLAPGSAVELRAVAVIGAGKRVEYRGVTPE